MLAVSDNLQCSSDNRVNHLSTISLFLCYIGFSLSQKAWPGTPTYAADTFVVSRHSESYPVHYSNSTQCCAAAAAVAAAAAAAAEAGISVHTVPRDAWQDVFRVMLRCVPPTDIISPSLYYHHYLHHHISIDNGCCSKIEVTDFASPALTRIWSLY